MSTKEVLRHALRAALEAQRDNWETFTRTGRYRGGRAPCRATVIRRLQICVEDAIKCSVLLVGALEAGVAFAAGLEIVPDEDVEGAVSE